MRAALITGVYDSYDTLKPVCPQEGVDVEWIVVTDGAPLPEVESTEGWTLICDPRPGVHPNRAAKRPKMLPWKYTDADCSVWVDASYRVTSPYFVRDVLALADPIAQFLHPWRDDLFAEAEESVRLAKYAGEPCAEQVARYRALGMPERFGLWATGVIARRHTDKVRAFGEVWLGECETWSFQDQLSHPYACWVHGLYPTALPGNHLDNAWLSYEGSGRH